MGGRNIESAIDGTRMFLRRLATDDDIYVNYFADTASELQPSGQAGEVIEQLDPKINGLKAQGGTALYQSICDAVKSAEQLKQVDLAAGEERLYGVVVLSDGDDTSSEITLDQLMNTCLPSGEDVAGIKVYTIAYGDDADQDVLKKISKQTNGKMFVSGVDNIREVYLNISAEQ
jgi:Ca-activated chloride channel family protein